jgi:hypothetical protein
VATLERIADNKRFNRSALQPDGRKQDCAAQLAARRLSLTTTVGCGSGNDGNCVRIIVRNVTASVASNAIIILALRTSSLPRCDVAQELSRTLNEQPPTRS